VHDRALAAEAPALHRPMKKLLSTILLAAAFAANAQPAAPASAPAAPKPQQFVYLLKVSPVFHDVAKWTPKENEVVGRHFARLKEATAAGRVIFAGRTNEALAITFGLVVFEAENEPAARQFMESDPAVAAGLMTATLHPYVLALQRRP
jgi:uncharacterized protein